MSMYNDASSLESALNSDTEVVLDWDTIRSYEFGLSTTDNPFDLFENFRSWWNFDHQKGYNTSELVAATTSTTNDLGDNMEKKLLVSQLQDLVRVNASGVHRIVVRPVQ